MGIDTITMKKKFRHCLLLCWGLAVASVLIFYCVPAAMAGKSPESDVSTWLAELSPADAKMHSKNASMQPDKTAPKKVSAKSGAKKNNMPQNISIDFYKVDLHNVFRLLGRISGKNIVVDEGVKGTLTLALQDVPWTFVLQVIKNLKGLSSQEVNNTIMIYPGSKKMTWETASTENADMNLIISRNDVSASRSGLSVTKGKQYMIKKGLDVKKLQHSETPPEKISQAAALIKRAEVAEFKGDLELAEKLYGEASEIWPDNADLLKKAADVALKNENEISAYNFAKKALAISPDDSEAATIAAVSLARMNKPGEAKTYFEKAVSGPNVPMDALWNYAVFLFSHNDFRNALRLITRIEMNYSLTPDLMMLKAKTYENLGRKDKAVEEYRAILSAGKHIPENMKQYARIQLECLAPGH